MNDNSTLPIPARFQALCELCGRRLDTRAEGVHQWTAGWVKQRGGGGGHGISRPVRAHRFACDYCIAAGAGQQSMF